MSQSMSDAQLAQIRENGLAVVSTQLDGSLLVREPDGTLLELDRKGDLQPHTKRVGRVMLQDLPHT